MTRRSSIILCTLLFSVNKINKSDQRNGFKSKESCCTHYLSQSCYKVSYGWIPWLAIHQFNITAFSGEYKMCILNKLMQKITFVINRILHPWCHDDIAVWHQWILLGARKGWPDQWYARHIRACVKAIDHAQHYQIFYDARYETRIRVKSTYTLPHFISSPFTLLDKCTTELFQ